MEWSGLEPTLNSGTPSMDKATIMARAVLRRNFPGFTDADIADMATDHTADMQAALAALDAAGYAVVEKSDLQKMLWWMDDHPEAIDLFTKLEPMLKAAAKEQADG